MFALSDAGAPRKLSATRFVGFCQRRFSRASPLFKPDFASSESSETQARPGLEGFTVAFPYLPPLSRGSPQPTTGGTNRPRKGTSAGKIR